MTETIKRILSDASFRRRLEKGAGKLQESASLDGYGHEVRLNAARGVRERCFSVDWLDLREPRTCGLATLHCSCRPNLGWETTRPQSWSISAPARFHAAGLHRFRRIRSGTHHWRSWIRIPGYWRKLVDGMEVRKLRPTNWTSQRFRTSAGRQLLVTAGHLRSGVRSIYRFPRHYLAIAVPNRSRGLYALNYDGTTKWTPRHSLDGPVLSAQSGPATKQGLRPSPRS